MNLVLRCTFILFIALFFNYIKESVSYLYDVELKCPDDKKCVNSHCNGGVCECEEGYEYDYRQSSNDLTICSALCSFNCLNGTCIAPEYCECLNENFEHVGRPGGPCVPRCPKGCNGGTCIEFNRCACDEGYELVNRTRKRKKFSTYRNDRYMTIYHTIQETCKPHFKTDFSN